MIGEFYDHLLQFEELRGILSDPKLVERLKVSQRQYLLSLGQLGDYVEYAEARLRIGLTHERVGLKQKWYLGAYHKLFELILQRLADRYSGDARRLSSLVLTLNKVLRLDEIFVVETYYHATMQRQEDSLCQLKDAHRQLEGLSRQDPLTPVKQSARTHGVVWPWNFAGAGATGTGSRCCFSMWTISKRSMTGMGMRSAIMCCSTWCSWPGEDPSSRYHRPVRGEEFVIGLVECDQAGALQIAERIRLKIAQDPVRVGTACHRGDGQHRGRDVISGN